MVLTVIYKLRGIKWIELCNAKVGYKEWVKTVESLRDSCQWEPLSVLLPLLARITQPFYSVNWLLTTHSNVTLWCLLFLSKRQGQLRYLKKKKYLLSISPQPLAIPTPSYETELSGKHAGLTLSLKTKALCNFKMAISLFFFFLSYFSWRNIFFTSTLWWVSSIFLWVSMYSPVHKCWPKT